MALGKARAIQRDQGSNTTMSGSLRLALILLALVFGGWIAVKVVGAVLGWVLSLLVPIVALGVVVGILYFAFNRKALPGGRRRTLL